VNSEALRSPVSRSVALHALLLMVALFYVTHAPQFMPKQNPIVVDVVDLIKPKDHVPTTEAENKKTVVQKSEGEEVKHAVKDAYLSDKSRVVKTERSATRSGENVMAGKPTTATQDSPQEKAQKVIKLSDLGLKLETKPQTAYEKERHWANSQTGETIRGGQYIQGMKEGEVSALNTKEFVFYSYFERVRRQLDQAWQPLLREQIQRIYKNGRHLASSADYVTKTLVSLDARGNIVKVQILEESGTTDLDQVAVDALNKAGPYPNPPKGLMDGEGKVQIRWDFILKT
jgi:TonB family protein